MVLSDGLTMQSWSWKNVEECILSIKLFFFSLKAVLLTALEWIEWQSFILNSLAISRNEDTLYYWLKLKSSIRWYFGVWLVFSNIPLIGGGYRVIEAVIFSFKWLSEIVGLFSFLGKFWSCKIIMALMF